MANNAECHGQRDSDIFYFVCRHNWRASFILGLFGRGEETKYQLRNEYVNFSNSQTPETFLYILSSFFFSVSKFSSSFQFLSGGGHIRYSYVEFCGVPEACHHELFTDVHLVAASLHFGNSFKKLLFRGSENFNLQHFFYRHKNCSLETIVNFLFFLIVFWLLHRIFCRHKNCFPEIEKILIFSVTLQNFLVDTKIAGASKFFYLFFSFSGCFIEFFW